MSKETGGAEFAQGGFVSSEGQTFVSADCGGSGMKLRDHFAGLAMQGMLCNPGYKISVGPSFIDETQGFAATAYLISDAMLKARGE